VSFLPRILGGYCDPAIVPKLRKVQGIETVEEVSAYSSKGLN